MQTKSFCGEKVFEEEVSTKRCAKNLRETPPDRR